MRELLLPRRLTKRLTGREFSLYHLDRSIGQVMNLSLGTLLEAREESRHGKWRMR